MAFIPIDEDQARLIRQCDGPVEIRDAAGKHLGMAGHGCLEEDIRLAKERRAPDAPRLTTQELVGQLESFAPK